MARRGADPIAVICPNDGYAARGYAGMPCPDCGTEMVEDIEVVDDERPSYAGIHVGDDAAADPTAITGFDDEGLEGAMDGRESLEKLQMEELEHDGEEPYE